MTGRRGVLGFLLPLIWFSCRGDPAFFLRTSFAAPRTWSLVDPAGRPVTVRLEIEGERVRFQAGVVREAWSEGAGGYTHADTLSLLYAGRIHSWVFVPFIVYPLPPLPGIHRENHRVVPVVWGQDTLTVGEDQVLMVQEGPEIVLTRNLSLNGTEVFRERRRFRFDGGDLVAFEWFRVLQGDTLHLDYRRP